MKNYEEVNFVAGADISEGQVVYFDATNSCVKPASAATINPIGVAGQTVSEGQACNIHSFATGHAFYVACSETIAAGDAIGLDANGKCVKNDDTASEKALPLIAMEAKTISSGTDLVQCICVDYRAVNA